MKTIKDNLFASLKYSDVSGFVVENKKTGSFLNCGKNLHKAIRVYDKAVHKSIRGY